MTDTIAQRAKHFAGRMCGRCIQAAEMEALSAPGISCDWINAPPQARRAGRVNGSGGRAATLGGNARTGHREGRKGGTQWTWTRTDCATIEIKTEIPPNHSRASINVSALATMSRPSFPHLLMRKQDRSGLTFLYGFEMPEKTRPDKGKGPGHLLQWPGPWIQGVLLDSEADRFVSRAPTRRRRRQGRPRSPA